MKVFNGMLGFIALNSLLAAGILFKLSYEKIAIIPLSISLLGFAVLGYLHVCRMYLLASLKKKINN
ncbi:MAG: hypothetical protein JNM14_13215 [Ferruginibacter sp.]|nr:hypothetical protein [Ferruginibacter sp.]